MSVVEVAEKAGVSRMTVSRVIRGAGSVRPETRQRVLSAMKELNYIPSAAARAIRSKDQLRISGSLCCGLIFTAETYKADGFFADIARAAEYEAAKHGLCLLQTHLQEDFEASWPRLQAVFSIAGLCGAVLCGQFTREEVQAIEQHARHVVVVDSPLPAGTTAASVRPDNVGGCKLAVEHLVERGARRLLVMTGRPGHYFSQAMAQAAEQVRSRCEVVEVVDADFTAERAREVVRELFRGGRPFDGLFGNDETAIGALAALGGLGVGVPEEVRVVGFDDIVHVSFTRPALTTVRVDRSLLGREAVKTLVEMVRGESELKNITKLIHATLIVREST